MRLSSIWQASAGGRRTFFFIPKDELPDGDPTAALADCYGAEAGDRVVAVGLTQPARAWSVPTDVSSTAAAR